MTLADVIAEIVTLFNNLNLTLIVMVGLVVGVVGWLGHRLTRAGR